MARCPAKKPNPPRRRGQEFAVVTPNQVFDADFSRKYNVSFKPVSYDNDPSESDRLKKCSALAIANYNMLKGTNYQVVNVEMATYDLVAGIVYHITFKARNAENECSSFQATVFHDKYMREVMYIRKKGSRNWCDGSLSEVVKTEPSEEGESANPVIHQGMRGPQQPLLVYSRRKGNRVHNE
ncbi:unnamed protein product [Trifolium pratense]|uniref:Uncharacterized protein n=1 Tax=Trifolium pratense TaxID=57577 RepID=A0ACB0L1H6_TRIPR|nr:unnamed protein product [Trifolium pratense]